MALCLIFFYKGQLSKGCFNQWEDGDRPEIIQRNICVLKIFMCNILGKF